MASRLDFSEPAPVLPQDYVSPGYVPEVTQNSNERERAEQQMRTVQLSPQSSLLEGNTTLEFDDGSSLAIENATADVLANSKLNGQASWTRVIVLTILVAASVFAALTTASTALMITSICIGGLACLTAIWMMYNLIKNSGPSDPVPISPRYNSAIFNSGPSLLTEGSSSSEPNSGVAGVLDDILIERANGLP